MQTQNCTYLFFYLFINFIQRRSLQNTSSICTNQNRLPLPHPLPLKKHNKHVNESVKKDNRMRIQFFQISPTCWMYVLYIPHGHFSPFHFPISFLKISKEDAFYSSLICRVQTLIWKHHSLEAVTRHSKICIFL